MEIPNNIVNEIVNYLARQPYREVANMINGIMQAQAQEKSALDTVEAETDQKELPLVCYLDLYPIINSSFTNLAIAAG